MKKEFSKPFQETTKNETSLISLQTTCLTMKHKFLLIYFLVALFSFEQGAIAQTTIYNGGMVNTNSDGPVSDFSGPVDISNCSSIAFSVTYSFSLPWDCLLYTSPSPRDS